MKKQLILFACTLLSSMLFSQAVPMALEEFRTNDGTQNFFYKNVTRTDGAGNVIVAGATMNGATTDILVAKYNSSGVQLWIKQFQGTAPGGVDFAAGLAVTDTHVYISGAISNNTVTPETDIVTMKLATTTGSVVWSAAYSGAGGLHDASKAIVVDASSGNVFVSGGTYNTSLNTDYVTLCYNSSGVQQWAKTWDYLGGDDGAIAIQLSGSNVSVGGAVSTPTAGVYKRAVLSLSQSTGSLLATSIATAVTTTSVDVVTDLALDGTNLILIGSNNVTGQGTNFYVQKLTNALANVWTYTCNGSASLNDVAKGVSADASSNVYVTGFTTSATLGKELTLIKLNSSGTQQWLVTSGFSGDDEGSDMVIDGSGNVYLTGYKTVAGNKNYYTAKYNSSGTKVWEAEMNGVMTDYATNITLDSLNNVIVTGQTEVSAGIFSFTTVKYAQRDVITPTDFNGETPSANFMYYANRGQLVDTNQTAVPYIKYYTHNTYPSFYFKDRSQSFVFSRLDTVAATADTIHRIDLNFTNSLESSKTYAMNEQENGYLNYFLAHTGSEGVTGVKGNLRLVTPNLYSNIDLMCSSNQNGIKYYFIIKPGGDMRNIKMEFTGATSYSLNGSTNALSIKSSIGSLTFDKPVAYQLTAGNATVAVTSFSPTWTTDGATNKYKFNDGVYTTSLTLVIEVDQGNGALAATSINNPVWCTDVGSPNYDQVWGVDSDLSGSLYATGYTMDHTFPNNIGIYSGAGGSQEAFLQKYAPGGTPKWRIIYGGTETDQALRVKVDNTNNQVYMVGWTSDPTSGHATNFPLQNNGGYYHTPAATGSTSTFLIYSFITKFNMTSGLRSWATLFGDDANNAPNQTFIYGIDVAPNGDLYVGGTTNKHSNFPIVTPSTGCTVYTQNNTNVYLGFVAKFNSSNSLVWSTLFGNDGTIIEDLKINTQNQLFITGYTSATNTSNFPLKKEFSNDYYQTYAGGNSDAFVAKFSSCLELAWSTLFGGTADDIGNAIEISEGTPAAKTANTITYTYISGNTKSSTSFPILGNGNSNGINDNTLGGTQDGFIASFNGGNEQTWTTYVGGSNIDELNDMEFGIAGTLLLTGSTKSTDFLNKSLTGAYTQTQLENTSGGNDYDAVIVALDGKTNFTKIWSTWFGGNTNLTSYRSDDYGYGITTSNSIVYVGGLTWSYNNFPWNADLSTYPNAYYQPYLQGNFSQDGFLAQFNLSLTPVSVKELFTNDDSGFLIYPNPSNGLVYILLNENLVKENQQLNIQVFDIQGREVLTKPVISIPNENFSINLSKLSTGMYFVKLLGENLNKSQKIIINN